MPGAAPDGRTRPSEADRWTGVPRAGPTAPDTPTSDPTTDAGGSTRRVRFAGAGSAERHGASPLADVLPVRIARRDDRVERPAEATPHDEGVSGADRPAEWPPVPGDGEPTPAPGADVRTIVGGAPPLRVDDVAGGCEERAFEYASDPAPDRASQSCRESDGSDRRRYAVLEWVIGE